MRDLALLLFVTATLPMAFKRPIIGLMLWILFSYMNPHRLTWGFATTLPWVMVIALVTMFTTLMHADQRQRIPPRTIVVLMTLFVIWAGVTTLGAIEPTLASHYFTRFFKVVLLAYFTLILVTDEQKLHWVLWTIVLSFGFWGFKGGLFTVLTGGHFQVLGPGHSFFRDRNDFALVMCMTLPLMRYLQLHATHKWVNIGLWILMGLTACSVIGTYSRGGFLALGVTVFMLIYKSRRRASLLLIVPLAALALGAFMPQSYYQRIETITHYQQNTSAEGRIQSWKFAANYAIHHPIMGGGMHMYASDAAWEQYGPPGATHRAVHSIWFEILSEQSFIGLALYISMFVVGWLTLARIRKRTVGRSDTVWMADLASMIQVSLVAFMTAGTFLPMGYFSLFFQLLAIVALIQVFSLVAIKKPATDESQPLPTAPSHQSKTPNRPIASRRKPTRHREKKLPHW